MSYMLTAVFSLDVLPSLSPFLPVPVLEASVESRVSIERDVVRSSCTEELLKSSALILGDDLVDSGEWLRGLRGVGGTTTNAGDSIDAYVDLLKMSAPLCIFIIWALKLVSGNQCRLTSGQSRIDVTKHGPGASVGQGVEDFTSLKDLM
jgi:hypothetical protein